MSEPVLVSACLLGLPTRYDGADKQNTAVLQYLRDHDLQPIPVCPEQLGGLATPRPKAQIVGGTGADILNDQARVQAENGDDVTAAFRAGAYATLKTGQLCDCNQAILKEKSPSCGRHQIYRGPATIDGQGVTTALLLRHNLTVLSDEDLL